MVDKPKKYKAPEIPENTRVIIALPCQNTVQARCAFSLVHAVRNVDFDVDMIMRMGCDIIGSRVWLVKRAREMGGTHILFVDDDMFFAANKENPIEMLLAHDKDIVGVPYNFRQFPLKSTAVPLTDITPTDQLFKCKALGTGFLLIKLSVFDKIPEPWFQFGRAASGDLVYGEDAFFCQEAQKAGFDVWADPKVNVNHIGEFLF